MMQLLAEINPENVSAKEISTYPTREAVRTIVTDGQGKIALLHVTGKNYYKLPGGGIEAQETHLSALQRECLEEIGCEIEICGEVGRIIERRKFCRLKQISYCYLAQVKGKKGQPMFTADEIQDGFEVHWLESDKAYALLNNTIVTDLEGEVYIGPRDSIFLKVAQGLAAKK